MSPSLGPAPAGVAQMFSPSRQLAVRFLLRHAFLPQGTFLSSACKSQHSPVHNWTPVLGSARSIGGELLHEFSAQNVQFSQHRRSLQTSARYVEQAAPRSRGRSQDQNMEGSSAGRERGPSWRGSNDGWQGVDERKWEKKGKSLQSEGGRRASRPSDASPPPDEVNRSGRSQPGETSGRRWDPRGSAWKPALGKSKNELTGAGRALIGSTAVGKEPGQRTKPGSEGGADEERRARLVAAARPEPIYDPAHVQTSGPLLGRSLPELEALAVALGQPKFRGRQLHDAVYKSKVDDISEVGILSKALRQVMVEKGLTMGRAPVHHVALSTDGTAKLLLKLDDGRLVEAVGIPSQDGTRLTACISSQVGCPLRCSFCATGKGGFARNLQVHEIVGQVLAVERHFQKRVSNIVLMGMGEPMLNLPHVVPAVLCINKDIGIGQRMITISTVGVPNSIRKLAQLQLQCTLAISLHAPNQSKREQIIPSAKAYPLEALLSDCQEYFNITGRRVTFEYTLLAGVNDSAEDAAELADLLFRKKLAGHVNLIPYNPVEDSEYGRPSNNRVMTFASTLNAKKVTTSIRQTRGLDANAACGQLRNAFQKTPLPVA